MHGDIHEHTSSKIEKELKFKNEACHGISSHLRLQARTYYIFVIMTIVFIAIMQSNFYLKIFIFLIEQRYLSIDALSYMKSIIYNISKEQLQNYINQSSTYGQVLKLCGLRNHGRNPDTLKRRIQEENLNDTPIKKGLNFGGGWNKGTKGVSLKRMSKEQALSTLFVSNYQGSVKIRKYIRCYKLIDEKCIECNLSTIWNNKPITLEIDHIDGDSQNNLLSNLRWLCPNCHSQTNTFRGRNQRKEQLKNGGTGGT